jgi:hypothetical protein
MDAETQKFHLLLAALEASTILALEKLHHAHPIVAQKRIHIAQLQASSLGSQLGHAQLEDALQDNPTAHGYASIQPIKIDAGITIGMLGVVARTAIIEAYRTSAIAVYSANHVDGWIWEVEGDDPCDWCLSMDGTIHPISEEFESHPSCRCSTLPYLP